MLAAVTLFGLDLAEIGLIALALAFIAEVLGVSRSTRVVRAQNADLRERNSTLEERVALLEARARELEREVETLKERNVDALYEAFTESERQATERHAAMMDVLDRIAGLLDVPA